MNNMSKFQNPLKLIPNSQIQKTILKMRQKDVFLDLLVDVSQNVCKEKEAIGSCIPVCDKVQSLALTTLVCAKGSEYRNRAEKEIADLNPKDKEDFYGLTIAIGLDMATVAARKNF